MKGALVVSRDGNPGSSYRIPAMGLAARQTHSPHSNYHHPCRSVQSSLRDEKKTENPSNPGFMQQRTSLASRPSIFRSCAFCVSLRQLVGRSIATHIGEGAIQEKPPFATITTDPRSKLPPPIYTKTPPPQNAKQKDPKEKRELLLI